MNKNSISKPDTSRIFPTTLPEGFSIQLNVLESPSNILVRHRPDEDPLYPVMGEWGENEENGEN